MDNNKITKTIMTQVNTLTSMPIIIEPNKSYTPVIGTPYIRTTLTQGEPVQITAGVTRTLRYTGTLQIDHFFKANTGDNNVIDRIITLLNAPNSRFMPFNGNYILQIQNSWRGNDLPDTVWMRNTCYVRYYVNES